MRVEGVGWLCCMREGSVIGGSAKLPFGVCKLRQVSMDLLPWNIGAVILTVCFCLVRGLTIYTFDAEPWIIEITKLHGLCVTLIVCLFVPVLDNNIVQ